MESIGLASALNALASREDLDADSMTYAMEAIMSGAATSAQIGGFLIGLRAKGETVTELTAAARVMRRLATPVAIDVHNLVDTCGTGGDGSATFNVSTTAAFVAAAAGAHVAKHGNRAVSSRCGSADLLEHAGIAIALTPDQVATCIKTVGLGFLFAPNHHGAMRHAASARKDLGVRTVFNMLGPLTNPAQAANQVIGVYSRALLQPIAETARNLGGRHVLVVHAEDGLDEISVHSDTHIAELRNNTVNFFTVTPEQLGVNRHTSLRELVAENVTDSYRLMRSALQGKEGHCLDIVIANAGAALYVSGLASTLPEAVDIARNCVATGAAERKLADLRTLSQRLTRGASAT